MKTTAELKIKVVTLAFEQAAIHRDENKHREYARVLERAQREQLPRVRDGVLPSNMYGTPAAKRWEKAVVRRDRIRAEVERVRGWIGNDEQRRTDVGVRSSGHRSTWQSLRSHRYELKEHSRIALLAYGFLRGRLYSELEASNTREDPPWEEVYKTALRFSEGTSAATVAENWKEWKSDAGEYLDYGRRRCKKYCAKKGWKVKRDDPHGIQETLDVVARERQKLMEEAKR